MSGKGIQLKAMCSHLIRQHNSTSLVGWSRHDSISDFPLPPPRYSNSQLHKCYHITINLIKLRVNILNANEEWENVRLLRITLPVSVSSTIFPWSGKCMRETTSQRMTKNELNTIKNWWILINFKTDNFKRDS